MNKLFVFVNKIERFIFQVVRNSHDRISRSKKYKRRGAIKISDLHDRDLQHDAHGLLSVVDGPVDRPDCSWSHAADFPVPRIGIRTRRIFGVQYHPEKSHDAGQILLNNFLSL